MSSVNISLMSQNDKLAHSAHSSELTKVTCICKLSTNRRIRSFWPIGVCMILGNQLSGVVNGLLASVPSPPTMCEFTASSLLRHATCGFDVNLLMKLQLIVANVGLALSPHFSSHLP
jgi:hypothetical protein